MKKFYLAVIITFILSFMGVYAEGKAIKCCNEQSFIKGYILNEIIEENEKICLDGLLTEDNAEGIISEVIEENTKAMKVSGLEIKNENGSVFAYVEYEECLSLFESAEVSAEKERIFACVNDSMTDLEKALAVHDYMVQNYEYDLTYSIYSAEELFENKKGVCQAYALAYIEIMTELGIECKFVPSKPMDHAWNLIKIDGEWYHVDATWDDPVPDLLGRVNHIYFLISDSAIADPVYCEGNYHYGWEVSCSASSTKYDGYFWKNVSKPIINNGGNWYYMKLTDTRPSKGQIVKRNVSTGAESVIYTIDGVWWVWGNKWSSYYTNCFSGLGIYKDRIYYNTPEQIKSIDLSGKNVRVMHSPDVSEGYIYGIALNDGKIVYGLSTSPNNGIEQKFVYYIQYSIVFDANGGEVSVAHKNISNGEKYGQLPVPELEGYEFKGWYTEKDGGFKVTENTIFNAENDVVLYARWKKIPPQIVAKPEKKDGKCTVTVRPKWVDEEKVYIYVACYKEGKLSHIERRLYEGHEETFTADDNSDVKIMMWSGNELSNICHRIMINKSEFGN